MKYRVVKYKPGKRRKKLLLETYEPEKRVEFSKENAVPLLVRIGNNLAMLGGLIGFWASSGLMILRAIFGIEEKVKEKVRRFSFNKKVVEIRIKEK